MNNNNYNSLRSSIIKLSLGIFFVFIPFAPFFAMKDYWICIRNLFPSFIGIGLILSTIMDLLSFNLLTKALLSLFLATLVFFLLLGNVYELNYYRKVGIIDAQITQNLSEIISKNDIKKFILFGAKNYYVDTTSKRIENCTSSNWALSGSIVAQHGDLIKSITSYPVFDNSKMPVDKYNLNDFSLLGINDSLEVFALTAKDTSDGRVDLYRGGDRFGQITSIDEESENKNGIFTTKW
jgi:hypothetical protein